MADGADIRTGSLRRGRGRGSAPTVLSKASSGAQQALVAYFFGASTSIAGAASIVEADDTLAAHGSSIVGRTNVTEAGDTVSATGTSGAASGVPRGYFVRLLSF